MGKHECLQRPRGTTPASVLCCGLQEPSPPGGAVANTGQHQNQNVSDRDERIPKAADAFFGRVDPPRRSATGTLKRPPGDGRGRWGRQLDHTHKYLRSGRWIDLSRPSPSPSHPTQACKLRGWKVAKKGDAYDVMISDNNQSIKALMRMRTHPR